MPERDRLRLRLGGDTMTSSGNCPFASNDLGLSEFLGELRFIYVFIQKHVLLLTNATISVTSLDDVQTGRIIPVYPDLRF